MKYCDIRRYLEKNVKLLERIREIPKHGNEAEMLKLAAVMRTARLIPGCFLFSIYLMFYLTLLKIMIYCI